mgnify:FL=1
MVPWTVIYQEQQESEVCTRVVIAPISSAEAWAHCQHLTEDGVILALLKGSHEVMTEQGLHGPDGVGRVMRKLH